MIIDLYQNPESQKERDSDKKKGGFILIKRKMICIFLVVVIFIVVFSACSNKETSNGTTTLGTTTKNSVAVSTAEETETAEKQLAEQLGFDPYDDPITVSFLSIVSDAYGLDSTIEGRKSLADNVWIDAYRDYLNINVERTTVENREDLDELVNTMMAAEDLPDVLIVGREMYNTLKKNGLLADLSKEFDYARKDYSYFSQLLDTYYDEEVYFCQENDKLYGIPYLANASGIEDVLWLRQDWLDTAGVEAPETIDQLIEVATTIEQKGLYGDKGYAIGAQKGADTLLRNFISGYGVVPGTWVRQDDGKYAFADVLADKVKEPLLRLQEMYKNGLLKADFANADTDSDVANGFTGIVYGSWLYGAIGATAIDASFKNDEKADWIAAHLPSVTGEMVKQKSTANTQNICVVTTNCKNPEAIFKIMNFETYVCSFDENKTFRTQLYKTEDGYEIWNLRLFRYFVRGDTGYSRYQQARDALTRGEPDDGFTEDSAVKFFFNTGLAARNGDRNRFGINSVIWYSSPIVFELYKAGLLMYEYTGESTENIELYQEAINTDLKNAMVDVVMGAPISVYEQAVEKWYANGGQAITEDVNNYYARKNK